jgi:hypothetical protein
LSQSKRLRSEVSRLGELTLNGDDKGDDVVGGDDKVFEKVVPSAEPGVDCEREWEGKRKKGKSGRTRERIQEPGRRNE